jgi:hypothetical protein
MEPTPIENVKVGDETIFTRTKRSAWGDETTEHTITVEKITRTASKITLTGTDENGITRRVSAAPGTLVPAFLY